MRKLFVLMVFVMAGEAQAQCGSSYFSCGSNYSSHTRCGSSNTRYGSSYTRCGSSNTRYPSCSSSRAYTTPSVCSTTRSTTQRSTTQKPIVCDPVSPIQNGTKKYGGEHKAPAPKAPTFDRGANPTTPPIPPPDEEFKAPAPKIPVLYYQKVTIPRGTVSTLKWIWVVDVTNNIQFRAPVINGYMPRVENAVTMETKEIKFSYSKSLKYKDYADRIKQRGFITYGPKIRKDNLVASR